ncbi:4a-hydroxytetrahydrobiopterin dehydratase [Candidatus Babeliales bacterium]|nr:4a-hydroxytetrahydrobiopterin dehydratase [Candidatus Babeliales bacterium]
MKIIFSYFVIALMIANNATALATCTLCENKKLAILPRQTINNFVRNHQRWRLEKVNDHQQLACSVPCNLADATRIISSITAIAETQQHHPDITVTQENVTISIYTHSQNALTGKDIAFVTAIEKYLASTELVSNFSHQTEQLSNKQRCPAQELTLFLAQNQYWQLTPDAKAVQFSYNAPSFEVLAKALGQCLQLKDISSHIVEVFLSYGTCSITLQDNNQLISNETLAQAQACQRIFDNLIAH